MISSFIIHLLILVGIYAILTLSLNLVLGYTGLLTFGHVALFAIGAYTSAILVKAGIPFLVGLIAGGIAASIFGLILILSTYRLKKDYFGLATLGFTFIIFALLLNLSGITNGALGISGIPKPVIFGISFHSLPAYLALVAVLALITYLILRRVVNSPFGNLMQGVRDDETRLKTLGKNTFLIKCKAMMLSAFFAGLAGSLVAHYLGFLDPGQFYIAELLFIMTMVIVGGIASLPGSLLGAAIIVILPDLLRFLNLPSEIMGPGRQILFSIILLAILLYKPRGLLGRIDLE